MSDKDNINVVRKLFEAYNKNDSHKLSAFDAIMAANVRFNDPALSNHAVGLKEMKQGESSLLIAFPTKKISVDYIFATQDKVVVRWSSTGVQQGSYQGIAPTHKQVTVSGMSIYTLANGKIVEVWQLWDRLALMEQLNPLSKAA